MDMTIKEVLERKRQLEQELSDRTKAFIRDTNLVPDSIFISTKGWNTEEGKAVLNVMEIRVRIEI